MLRGLSAIGPASAADLRCWSGLSGCKAALEGLAPGLMVFRDEQGRTLYDLPDAPRPRADTPAPVRLLPEYDNCLLSHEDRTRIVPAAHARRFAMGPNGRRPRALLVDGFVRGCWNVAVEGDEAVMTIEPFERLAAGERAAVEGEAQALLAFLEPLATRQALRWAGSASR